MPNSTLQVPAVVRMFASLTYTTICLIGLSMYALLSIVVVRNWKEIKNPFYTIACHLAVSDIGFSFIFLVLIVPRIFSPSSLYPERLGFMLPQLHAVFALSVFLQSFNLTFERSAIFLWSRVHAQLFEHGRVHYTMAVTWVFVALMSIHYHAFGCHNNFDFRWYFQCTDPGNAVHLLPFMVISGTLGSVMMAMYSVVFVYLKRNKNKKVAASREEAKQQRSRARAERKLLIQGFIICFMLQVMSVSFWFAPSDRPWGPVLLNFLMSVNSACNPAIALTFNKTIRDKVAVLFGIKKPAPVMSVKAVPTRSQKAATQGQDKQEVDEV